MIIIGRERKTIFASSVGLDRNLYCNQPCSCFYSSISIWYYCHNSGLPWDQLLYPTETDEKNGAKRVELFWIFFSLWKAKYQLLLHELWNQTQPGSVSQLWFQTKKSRILTLGYWLIQVSIQRAEVSFCDALNSVHFPANSPLHCLRKCIWDMI